MLAILVTFAVVIIDQIAKFLINYNMKIYDSVQVIPGILNFTYIKNKGAAWGIFADKRWIFLVFSAIAILLMIYILLKYRNGSKFMIVALSLALGGGIGNMIDRLFFGEKIFDGAVIDFIEAVFIDFPIFNIADCCVCVGMGLLVVYLLFFDGKNKRSQSDSKSKNSKSVTHMKDGENNG